ncbi:RNA polymerase sigma factor [Sphingobacterium tabacisoli]|uniref:RNA polymerase sigma factor n=1 Tax=Sphingobacterium tabacisoli TaxID=2044855 RepID=A0ABW5L7Q2_9SPHI|nr:RNA polymerase sigma-70 factor [Sphingobacterium tabacisoli]
MKQIALSEFDDEELFFLIKTQQSRTAYAEIYHRYWDILWRFALRHQINPDEAQDTLQDVFTALWQNRAKIEIKTKLSSFLYRATLNQILKKVDRQKVIATYIQRLGDKMKEQGLLIEEQIYEKELQSNLEEALREMPKKMRQVFEASRFEELSHEEIAQKLNISKETVKSQIKNALKIVRKHVNSLLFNFL